MNFLNDITVHNNITATGTLQSANLTLTGLSTGAYASVLVENAGTVYKRDLTLSLLPTGTEGQMLYNNGGTWTAFSGVFWDDTNNRFGVGLTSALAAKLTVRGAGLTSATYSFEAEDSAGTEVFRVRDDGVVSIRQRTPDATYGPELLTNPNFTSDLSGWTIGGGDWTWVSGAATHAAGAATTMSQLTVTAATHYRVKFSITKTSGTSLTISFGGVTVVTHTANTTTAYTYDVLTSTTAGFVATPTSDFVGSFDTTSAVVYVGNAMPSLVMYHTDGTTVSNEIRSSYTASNLGIGIGALQRADALSVNNVAIGPYAMRQSYYNTNNTCLGVYAGENLNNATSNVLMGYVAGQGMTIGTANVGIGYAALYSTTAASGNVAIGYNALRNAATGGYSVAIGHNPLYNNTGYYNSGIGTSAGFSNVGGTQNNYLGYSAGFSCVSGNYNTAVGGYALYYADAASSNNTALGYQALFGASGNACSSNTALGWRAGYVLTTGNSNIFIGERAGEAHTSGSSNIVIGVNIDAQSGTTDNQLTIGNALFGVGIDGIGTGVSSGRLGAFVAAPTARLHLPAGATTANNAPLKFTSGSNLSAAEAGAVEWDGTSLYITQTSGPTRKTIAYTDSVSNLTITNDTATNAVMYPTWVTATSGNLPVKIASTTFSINPAAKSLAIATTAPTSSVVSSYEMAPALAVGNPNDTYGRWSYVCGLAGGIPTFTSNQDTWGHSANFLTHWTSRSGTLTVTSTNGGVGVTNPNAVHTDYIDSGSNDLPDQAAIYSTVTSNGVYGGVVVTFDFDTALNGVNYQKLHTRPTASESFRPIVGWKAMNIGNPTNIKVTVSYSSDGTATTSTVYNDVVIFNAAPTFYGERWVGPSDAVGASANAWIRRVKFEFTLPTTTASGDQARILYLGLLSSMPTELDVPGLACRNRWCASQNYKDATALRWESSGSTGPWTAKDHIWGQSGHLHLRAPHSNGRVILGWNKAGTSTAVIAGVYESSVHKLRPESGSEDVQLGDATYAWNGVFTKNRFTSSRAAGDYHFVGNLSGAGDSYARFTIASDGMIEWGPGNVTRDTNLYRSTANVLKTDDNFEAAGYGKFEGVSISNAGSLSGTYGVRIDTSGATGFSRAYRLANLNTTYASAGFGAYGGGSTLTYAFVYALSAEATPTPAADYTSAQFRFYPAGRLTLVTDSTSAGLQVGSDVVLYRNGAYQGVFTNDLAVLPGSSGTNNYGLNVSKTYAADRSGEKAAIYCVPTYNAAASAGGDIQQSIRVGGSWNFTASSAATAYGAASYLTFAGSGGQASITPFYSSGTVGAGFTVPVLRHFHANGFTNSGTITDHRGVDVGDLVGTNVYGVRVNVTSGSNKYGLYTSTAENYLGGKTTIEGLNNTALILKNSSSSPWAFQVTRTDLSNTISMFNDAGKWFFNENVSAPILVARVATGTSPLAIASTTVVTNLNADLLDGQHGSYYTSFATNYVQSRLENLVTNGSGLLGGNTNFSGWTYDQIEVHGGAGSFKYTGTSATKLNDEYIPVDPEKYYKMVVWAKAGDTDGNGYDTANRQYVGVNAYDIDFNPIAPWNFMKYTGATDTTLAVALNTGDSVVVLTDATGWDNGSGAYYQRQFSWWPYTNAKGYTYPDYTYSRNGTYNNTYFGNNGAWNAKSTNTLTLTQTWPGPNLPVGTKVRNMSSGGSYKYCTATNVQVPNAWTRYEGYIGGYDTQGVNSYVQFPYGTAYVKLLFLTNYAGGATAIIRYSDITFSEIDQRLPGSASLPAYSFYTDLDTGLYWNGANSLGFSTAGTQRATLDSSGLILNSIPVSATRYTSTVSTGTAPFTVSSSTVVANLNADMLDGLNSTSFSRLDAISHHTQNFGGERYFYIDAWARGVGTYGQGSVGMYYHHTNGTVIFDRYTDWAVNGTQAGSFFLRIPSSGSVYALDTSSTAQTKSGNLTATTFIGALTGNVTGNCTGSSGTVAGQSGQLLRYDNRTLAPSALTATYLQYGFGSYANNNTGPYSDYIHMRGYSDSSGGADNVVMFLKTGIGIRVFQQTYGSGTAYSTYKSVVFSDGTYDGGTSLSGTWGISITGSAGSATTATTATTATNATNVGVTNDTTTNATMYPAWVTTTSGNLPIKVSSTKLTFNPSTGLLTATGFSGPLTGNVTGNCTGSSGSCTGNSASATYASTVTVAAAAGATNYLAMYTATTGNIATYATSSCVWNVTSSTLTVPNLTVSSTLTATVSNATNATNSTNVSVTDDVATGSGVYLTWVSNNTGNLPIKTSASKLSFVPSSGLLTAGQFSSTGSGSGYIINRRDTNASAWQWYSSSGSLELYDHAGSANRLTWSTAGTLTISATSANFTGASGVTINGGPTILKAAAFGSPANFFAVFNGDPSTSGNTINTRTASQVLSDIGAASSGHSHSGVYATTGAVTSSGLTMSTARLLGRITAATGAIEEISVSTGLTLSTGSLFVAFGSTGSTACVGNDSRLSDSRNPLPHTHGNITNAGTIGSTSGLPIITTTSGVLTTGSFGSSAGTFCQGNDSRLSDPRNPTAHTHPYTEVNNITTARLLGRTTAGTGACELISLANGTNCAATLSATTLTIAISATPTFTDCTVTGKLNLPTSQPVSGVVSGTCYWDGATNKLWVHSSTYGWKSVTLT